MDINLKDIEKLPSDVRKEFYRTYLKFHEKKKEANIQKNFMSFVKHVWPDFIEGKHHQ